MTRARPQALLQAFLLWKTEMPNKPLSSVAARLRMLPKVDKVMRLAPIQRLLAKPADTGPNNQKGCGLPQWAVLAAVRKEIARLRADCLAPSDAVATVPGKTAVAIDFERIAATAQALVRPTLRPVLNATGVVLHTNLGRAPLPELALQRIAAVAGGYLTLEYQLEDGERGSRQDHAAALLAQLFGAEASLVVNNNAAAVLLMLSGLCSAREVVVSRGELVEIGGSFRIPDVMRQSGAKMREVGTTNRTRLADYQAAVTTDTKALLKVHRSNFAVVGFTEEVSIGELCRLAHEKGLLCFYDTGSGLASGSLDADLSAAEPSIAQALAAGCDVVCFSCDKLLGGPQAGVLCGTRAAIEPLRQHPLLRALRPDKLTLLALCATLELHRDGRLDEIPTLAMLNTPLERLRARAERLQALCAAQGLAVTVVATRSAVGGGAMPLVQPESYAIAPICDAAQARRIEAALRSGAMDEPWNSPAVVARLAENRLLCDVRTLREGDLPVLARALVAAARHARA